MPGLDAGTDAAVTVYPAGWDPMIESLGLLHDNAILLQRIAASLERLAPSASDVTIYVPPGKSDGTIKATLNLRVRIKRIYVTPLGTGYPVLAIGMETIALGAIQAVPVPIDFPTNRVVQEGVDLFLYDSVAPTVIPSYAAFIFGTAE